MPKFHNAMCISALLGCSVLLAGCRENTAKKSASNSLNVNHPPASQSTGKQSNNSSLTNTKQPQSVVLFTKEVQLDNTQEAKIELKDGVTIEIPAEALAAKKLTISKYRYAPSGGQLLEEFEYYTFDAGENAFKANLLLHFPLDLAKEVDPADVRVLHHLETGETKELAGVYDRQKKSFTVEVSSFSEFSLPQIPNPFDRIASTLASTTVQGVHLRPRYYSQFDHGWCWATSFAMVISSYGNPIHPQEIAKLYNSNKSVGFGMAPIFGYSLDRIAKHPAASGLTLTPYRIGGMTEHRIRGFLIKQLDQRRPVWIGLPNYKPGSDHAVLIVGYRHNGFIIHDPSGALFAYLEKIDINDPNQRSDELANYFIPFDRWHKVVNPWKTQLVVVEQQLPADTSTCSLQIPLGNEGISFERTGTTFLNMRSVYNFWNGEHKSGAGFSNDQKDDRKLGVEGLSNSDYITKLNVLLHNTGKEDVLCSIDLMLDGQVLLEKQAVTFKAGKTNQRLSLFQPRSARNAEPAKSPRPYTDLTKRKDIANGLDFNNFPLPLGEHKLEINLWDAKRSKQFDHVEIVFDQLPAITSQPKIEKKPGSSAESVTHLVRFDHSPEMNRLETHATPGKYTAFGSQKKTEQDKPNTVRNMANIV